MAQLQRGPKLFTLERLRAIFQVALRLMSLVLLPIVGAATLVICVCAVSQCLMREHEEGRRCVDAHSTEFNTQVKGWSPTQYRNDL